MSLSKNLLTATVRVQVPVIQADYHRFLQYRHNGADSETCEDYRQGEGEVENVCEITRPVHCFKDAAMDAIGTSILSDTHPSEESGYIRYRDGKCINLHSIGRRSCLLEGRVVCFKMSINSLSSSGREAAVFTV